MSLVNLKYGSLVKLLLVVCLVSSTVGCTTMSNKPTRPVAPDEEGLLVIKFSRDATSAKNITSSNPSPRDVNTIKGLVTGYRVWVTGPYGVNTLEDAVFEEGKSEASIALSLPVGDGYSIKVLAFGDFPFSTEDILLGSGGVDGVTIGSESTTSVAIPMEPIQYDFSGTPGVVRTGESIPVSLTLRAPLMATALFPIEEPKKWSAWLVVSSEYPTFDPFLQSDTVRTPDTVESSSSDELTITYVLQGRTEPGTLYLQGQWNFNQEWNSLDGRRFACFSPSVALNDKVVSIEVIPSDGQLSIYPTW